MRIISINELESRPAAIQDREPFIQGVRDLREKVRNSYSKSSARISVHGIGENRRSYENVVKSASWLSQGDRTYAVVVG